jgi:hypothetical protein
VGENVFYELRPYLILECTIYGENKLAVVLLQRIKVVNLTIGLGDTSVATHTVSVIDNLMSFVTKFQVLFTQYSETIQRNYSSKNKSISSL